MNLGICFLKEYNLKLICTEEEETLMPVKDGSGWRAWLVDRRCSCFISKRLGKVLKAAEDQIIMMHVWRISH